MLLYVPATSVGPTARIHRRPPVARRVSSRGGVGRRQRRCPFTRPKRASQPQPISTHSDAYYAPSSSNGATCRDYIRRARASPPSGAMVDTSTQHQIRMTEALSPAGRPRFELGIMSRRGPTHSGAPHRGRRSHLNAPNGRSLRFARNDMRADLRSHFRGVDFRISDLPSWGLRPQTGSIFRFRPMACSVGSLVHAFHPT